MAFTPFLLPPIVIKNLLVPGLVFWYFKRLPKEIRYHFALKFLLLLLHSNVMSFLDLGFYYTWLSRSAFGIGAFACVSIFLFLHRFFFFTEKPWLYWTTLPAFLFGLISFTPLVVEGMDGRNTVGGPLHKYYILAPLFCVVAYAIFLAPNYRNSEGHDRTIKKWILIIYGVSVFLIFSTNLVYPRITGRSDLSGFGAYWILIPVIATIWIIASSRTVDLSFKNDSERQEAETAGIPELTYIEVGRQILNDGQELARKGGGKKTNLRNPYFQTRLAILNSEQALLERRVNAPTWMSPDSSPPIETLTHFATREPIKLPPPANKSEPGISFFALDPKGDFLPEHGSRLPTLHLPMHQCEWSIENNEFSFSTQGDNDEECISFLGQLISGKSAYSQMRGIQQIQFALFEDTKILKHGHYLAEIEFA